MNKTGVWNFCKIFLSISLFAFFSGGLLFGCGGSDKTDGTSIEDVDISSGYPSGLAVASPTSSGSSLKPSFKVGQGSSALYAGTVEADATFAAKNAAYAAIIAGASAAACQVTLPPLTAGGASGCYGPALDYQNHPDGPPWDGQLPTGDLGIWSSTQGGTEACTAAKINALIENTATKVDNQMLLAASMLCLMKRAGTALPLTDGASVTMTTELNTAIQVNNPSVTISLAKLENLANVTDSGTSRDVFKLSITSSDSSGANVVSTSFMKHMPTSSSNSTFKGRLWAELSGASGAGDKDAYAILYEKASASSMKYRMVSAAYQGATSATTIFDSDGDIDVTGGWTGNIAQGIINLDPSTGLGNFSYSWQAGTGDDKARIFNGFTQSASGCGFFGYGGRFDNTAGTRSDNVIDGFICNWAGPGNDHSMATTANKAQKQCMTVDSATGVFGVNLAKENITYSPTVSCNRTGTEPLVFGTKLPDDASYDTTPVTNDLVDLTTDTDFTTGYTAPSAPVLPSGL
ncbi:MAG: hypothetical protein ACE5FU_01775 [Nitrospinota bacterium]